MNTHHCWPHYPTPVWPRPCVPGFPWDNELDRLRRLEREYQAEAEKERIRDRLRQMGVPEHVIQGSWPCRPVLRPVCPSPVGPVRLDDVLRRIR